MVEPYGVVKVRKIKLQGETIGGNLTDNDWRITVENDGLKFQYYDPTANNNAGAFVTKQSFGVGSTGITVTPTNTYTVSGALKVNGSFLLKDVDEPTPMNNFAYLYPSKTNQQLHYIHAGTNNGNAINLCLDNTVGINDGSGIGLYTQTTTENSGSKATLHFKSITGSNGIGVTSIDSNNIQINMSNISASSSAGNAFVLVIVVI